MLKVFTNLFSVCGKRKERSVSKTPLFEPSVILYETEELKPFYLPPKAPKLKPSTDPVLFDEKEKFILPPLL